MKKIYWALILCLLLAGCQDDNSGLTAMPHQEIHNTYTNRRVLILTKKSDYILNFLEQLKNRAGRYYSVTIDDLNNIKEYNFAYYNGVLIIEFLQDGSAPVLDDYMELYSGINNIVLFGLNDNYISPYPISVVTANTTNTDNLPNTVERIYDYLRSK